MKSAVPLIPLPSRCVLSRPFPEILLQCVLNITGRVLPASADPLMIPILMQRRHLLHLRLPRVSPITFSETHKVQAFKLGAQQQQQQEIPRTGQMTGVTQDSCDVRDAIFTVITPAHRNNTGTHAKAGMRVRT